MKWLVTGGCGFIGSNVAEWLARDGEEVVVFDNLSRPRVHRNLARLRDELGLDCVVADIRDGAAVRSVLRDHGPFDVVAHLAGQVSFLASLRDPRYDFETNANGMLNLLEAVRDESTDSLILYSSTNKVYGDLDSVPTEERTTRYELPTFPHGVPNDLPLVFQGGYSCSKGIADQLLMDWCRFHGTRGVSLRQSSIYGGKQFATEDQGWAAFFAERFVTRAPYRINGNGKQVRDLLHVADLYRLFTTIAANPDSLVGRAFNVGGGETNNLSLLELFGELQARTGWVAEYESDGFRPADQRVFIADVRELKDVCGWEPTISVSEGLDELVAWAEEAFATDV
jgi:CDP-paratose 2-epimerase